MAPFRLSCATVTGTSLIVLATALFYTYFLQHQPHAALLAAVKSADHARFVAALHRAIISDGMTANNSVAIDEVHFGNGRTLAHAVAMHGTVPMLDTIIDYGANIDSENANDGRRPIHVAAIFNSVEFINRMVATGCTVNSRAHSDWTPLLFAILFSRTDTVRRLLELGADANDCVRGGLCAVQLAIVYSNDSVVSLLVEYGAVLKPEQSYYEDWKRIHGRYVEDSNSDVGADDSSDSSVSSNIATDSDIDDLAIRLDASD